MSQQILIIGLGQFGMSLAKTLSERGAEVLAVDIRRQLVEEAANFVTEALIVNGADETALAKLEPGKRDIAVCAIGEEAKESSIICTALLRQMGAPLVIARSNDQLHYRILQLVGAHQIVRPEQEFGERFANRLLYKDVIVETGLGEDLHLTELAVQPDMVGKNLVELALPKRFGALVVGIRKQKDGVVVRPSPHEPLQEGDNLIVVSDQAAIPRLIEGVGK